MTMLIPADIRARLLANGEKTKAGIDHDPRPVVKLFTPDGNATWLLSELDPDDPDTAFGLCDLGLGDPELCTVSIRDLKRLSGGFGLPVERDLAFVPDKSIWSRFSIVVMPTALFRAIISRENCSIFGASVRFLRYVSGAGQSPTGQTPSLS